MKTHDKPKPSLDMIEQWLNNHLVHGVSDVVPLEGGFWSSAYRFRTDGKSLVLRLGQDDQGYRIDQKAMAFANDLIPVPRVLEIGKTMELHYAISEHHIGDFIETRPEHLTQTVSDSMASLLIGLKSVDAPSRKTVTWYDTASQLSWPEYLKQGLVDDPELHTSGWSTKLQGKTEISQLFEHCRLEIERLLPYCSTRWDLVHGDLLHQNVLVNSDASKVTGVFSWKCSAFGDFLYDLAWCNLWQSWFPCIDGGAISTIVMGSSGVNQDDLRDAEQRYRCCLLQIAASHIVWYLWTEDDENLERLAAVASNILVNRSETLL